MKRPYLRDFKTDLKLSDYPDSTAYEAGFLVSKNSLWRTKRPIIDESKCIGCLQCYLYCPDGVIYKKDKVVTVDYDFCKGCGICKKICGKINAIEMEEEIR